MAIRTKHALFALLLIELNTSVSVVHAQNTIDTPEGRAEVIGLRKWTAAMLADSLGLRAPGVSLFQTVEGLCLAVALLGSGGELVVAHAQAEDRESRDAARTLLLRLSGRATPPANWSAWIATLKK